MNFKIIAPIRCDIAHVIDNDEDDYFIEFEELEGEYDEEDE